jgi:hypothetical protein
MTRIHATFDGQVLKPEEISALEMDRRYLLTVEDEAVEAAEAQPHVLTQLAALATDLGPSDLAENHDFYARKR